MAELVIRIDDETYKAVMERTEFDTLSLGIKLIEAVQNGTPLPKEHGRLKDEDEIVKAIEDRVEFLRKNDAVFLRLRKDIDILGCIPKIRCEVPTIIEADKEKQNETDG